VNNAYRDKAGDGRLVFSGVSPDNELVEFIELDRSLHPYFVATQAHPELRSRPTKAASVVLGADRRRAGPAARVAAAGRRGSFEEGRRLPRRASSAEPVKAR